MPGGSAFTPVISGMVKSGSAMRVGSGSVVGGLVVGFLVGLRVVGVVPGIAPAPGVRVGVTDGDGDGVVDGLGVGEGVGDADALGEPVTGGTGNAPPPSGQPSSPPVGATVSPLTRTAPLATVT